MTKHQEPGWHKYAKQSLWGLVFVVFLCVLSHQVMFSMPGVSYQGALPPVTPKARQLAGALRHTVTHLASSIGPRNTSHYEGLHRTQRYIEKSFQSLRYDQRRIGFQMQKPGSRFHKKWVYSLEAERKGGARRKEIVVVGAHYDSAHSSPGANDNASGIAALLALAQHFRAHKPDRTLRFVAFVNEEPPYFRTSLMGSLYYARRCEARKEQIVAMLSLETIGYFRQTPGSQRYPPPLGLLYPSRGNFIGFVGNVASRSLVREALGIFRRHARIPSEGIATFALLPGIGWSDHWAFWQAGYPAIMITDTAPYRYPHYHKRSDTPEKLDYRRMALVVEGVAKVIEGLAKRR